MLLEATTFIQPLREEMARLLESEVAELQKMLNFQVQRTDPQLDVEE